MADFPLKGGAVKMVVNMNSDGNIAQSGDVASGTKTISLLPVNGEVMYAEITSIGSADVLWVPIPTAMQDAFAKLLGVDNNYYPAQTNYTLTVYDNTTYKKSLKEAKSDGNE